MAEEDIFAPASPAPAVIINRRLMVWDANGAPVLTTVPQITQQSLRDLYLAVAAQPYVPDPGNPIDAQYEGMTYAEVLVRKQILAAARSGDAEIVMDRLLGRPKQSLEQTKLTITYEDTLREIARKESLKGQTEPQPQQPIIDVPLANDEDIFS